MQLWVTFTIASSGFWMTGSGTSAIAISPLP